MAEQELSPQQVAENAFADFAYGPETTEDTSSTSQEKAPEAANEEIDDGSPPTPEIDEEATEGDSEAQAAEAENEGEEAQAVEVEYNGKLYEVPPELKDALMKNSDYTVKSQENATQRKEIEVQMGAVEQLKGQYEFAQTIWDDVKRVEALASNVDQYRQYLRENIESLGSSDIETLKARLQAAPLELGQAVDATQLIHDEVSQAMAQISTAIEEMNAKADAPKTVVYDSKGRVSGVRSNGVTKDVQRGSDGKITGL